MLAEKPSPLNGTNINALLPADGEDGDCACPLLSSPAPQDDRSRAPPNTTDNNEGRRTTQVWHVFSPNAEVAFRSLSARRCPPERPSGASRVRAGPVCQLAVGVTAEPGVQPPTRAPTASDLGFLREASGMGATDITPAPALRRRNGTYQLVAGEDGTYLGDEVAQPIRSTISAAISAGVRSVVLIRLTKSGAAAPS